MRSFPLIFTVVAALCLFSVTAEGLEPQVRGKVGGQVELECRFPPSFSPDVSSASLHVVEWVRQGLDIPVLIKFGSYAPRVHPRYEGRVSLVRVTAMRLENLRLEDQGLYECRILLLDKPIDELRNGTWTLLSVSAPPTFTEAPPPVVEALVGAHLSLTCVASGNPPPTITWIKDGSVIHQEGALSLQALTTQSAGQYTCHASNSEGNTSHMTRVKVKGPPVIVVPPKSSSLNMSQNALLRCQAVADPPNMTYVWQKGGENVHHIDSLKRRVKIMVDGTLLISSLVPGDSGNYTCTPSNGLLTPPTASANLTVMHPAQALEMPRETYLPTGMSGVVTCRAAAQPPLLRIDWTKDGEPLDLLLYPGWSWTPDGSLFMATVNDDAAGVYTCAPYNSYGSMGPSGPTTVILQDPPSFAVAPQPQYRQDVGRTLLVPCQGNDNPTVRVSWNKLDLSRRVSYSVEANGSLLLQPLTKDHQGAWECSVSNRVASVKASTRVFVLGTSPHPVSSLSVSPGLRQANVSWQPGFDGGAAQTYSVWVKKMSVRDDDDDDDEEKQSWFSVPVAPSSGNSVQVTDLSPATEYQFSVLSHNKLGSGPFSEIATTRTLDLPLRRRRLKPPALLSADGHSAGLLLRWTPPEEQHPPLTGFLLQCRSEDGSWVDLVENISANSSEMLVQGLQKDRVYELRLLSRSGELLSEPGPSVNVSNVGTLISADSSRQLDFVPDPLLAGVLYGVGFMCLALVVLLGSACVINHKRKQRHRRMRKRKDEESPAVIYKHSPSVKTSASGSPDSVLKKSLLPANNLYPTTSSTSSTSSSQTDCFSFSADDHLHYHHHHHHRRKRLPSHCSKGRLSRTMSSPVSPQIEMISRGPDGRFSLPSYDDALNVHSRKSVRYDRPAQVRRSVSLHSAGEDRKERPFVLSVDLPPCKPADDDSKGQLYDTALPLHNHFLFDQKENYDVFPDLSSLCSNTSLSTIRLHERVKTPTFPVLPHIKHGLGQPTTTASALVLQMEHERETGNLSRCLKLAQEREELERELHRYMIERGPLRDMKRGQEDPERHSPVDNEFVWEYKSRTLPHRCSQSIKKSIGLSSSPLSSSYVHWEARPLVSPLAGVSSPARASCLQSGSHHLPVEEVYGLTLPRFSSKQQRRERVESSENNNSAGKGESCSQTQSFSLSSFQEDTNTEASAASFRVRPSDGDTCAEMSVDEPDFEVFMTQPMLHHRIASHVQHGRSLTPRRQRHDMRRSQSLNCSNPASVDSVIRVPASPQPPEPDLWRIGTTSSKFWEKQRSRSLDSRRRKADNSFPTPDAWIESLSQENCSAASSSPADNHFWNKQNFTTMKIQRSPANSPSVAQSSSRSPPPVDTMSSNSPEQSITNPGLSFHYESSATASAFPNAGPWPIICHQQEAVKEAEGYLQEASRRSRPNINVQETLEVEAGGYEGVPESGSSYSSYASSGRGSMEPANRRMSLCHLSSTLSSSPETVEQNQGRTQDTRRHEMEPGQRRKASVDENYEWDAADVDSQPGNRDGLLPSLTPPPPQCCDLPSMHCSTMTLKKYGELSLHPGRQNICSAEPEPDMVLF